MPEFKTNSSVKVDGNYYYGFSISEKDEIQQLGEDVSIVRKIDMNNLRKGNILQTRFYKLHKPHVVRDFVVEDIIKKDDKKVCVISDRKKAQEEFKYLKNHLNNKTQFVIKTGKETYKRELRRHIDNLSRASMIDRATYPISIYPVPDKRLVRQYNIENQFTHMMI